MRAPLAVAWAAPLPIGSDVRHVCASRRDWSCGERRNLALALKRRVVSLSPDRRRASGFSPARGLTPRGCRSRRPEPPDGQIAHHSPASEFVASRGKAVQLDGVRTAPGGQVAVSNALREKDAEHANDSRARAPTCGPPEVPDGPSHGLSRSFLRRGAVVSSTALVVVTGGAGYRAYAQEAGAWCCAGATRRRWRRRGCGRCAFTSCGIRLARGFHRAKALSRQRGVR